MKPCSVCVVHMKDSGMEEYQLRTIQEMVGSVLWKWLKDKVKDIIYADRKNVNQTWCFKAT